MFGAASKGEKSFGKGLLNKDLMESESKKLKEGANLSFK